MTPVPSSPLDDETLLKRLKEAYREVERERADPLKRKICHRMEQHLSGIVAASEAQGKAREKSPAPAKK